MIKLKRAVGLSLQVDNVIFLFFVIIDDLLQIYVFWGATFDSLWNIIHGAAFVKSIANVGLYSIFYDVTI